MFLLTLVSFGVVVGQVGQGRLVSY